MADDKEFRQALDAFLYRLHVGANSGSNRQMDAWRAMGYDIPVAEVTGSAATKLVAEQAMLEVIKQETAPTEQIKTETVADPGVAVDPATQVAEVRKSLIANSQARPGQWWEGESSAELTDPKTLGRAYEHLIRSTQAQSTLKKDK
jgi:hypothetical protein